MDEPLAKPDQGLMDHLQQVASLGKEISSRLKLPGDVTKRAILSCWLHDIGKALESFQTYMLAIQALEKAKANGAPSAKLKELEKVVRSKKARAFPHALASAIPTLVIEKSIMGDPLLAVAAVLSHHSPLSESLYAHQEKPPEGIDVVINFIERLIPVLHGEGIYIGKEILPRVEKILNLSPAGILDTRIGKSVKLREKLRTLPRGDFAVVKTVLHLSDWLSSAHKKPEDIFLSEGMQKIQCYLKGKGVHPREFQKKAVAYSAAKKLAIQAPTGTGKTEALLLWAGDAGRIIYLLPTQATVNAMWKRLRKIYGTTSVGLAHGRSSYMLRKTYEEREAIDQRFFSSVFARPVVVATLDQFLIGHLQGRHWEERLTLSQKATVIFDEIHAYEPFTLGILKGALDSYPPERLAIASATLPSILLKLVDPIKKIRAEGSLWRRKRHFLQFRDFPIFENISEITEFAARGKRVLVIVNTVRSAQELYRTLSESGISPDKLLLLHSRFIFRDRLKKELEIENAAPGTILVATQVVEVSLDISYDLLFTETAPVDALVQRMGRVNRRCEQQPVPVIIHTIPGAGSVTIYGSDLLESSLSIIKGLPNSPTDHDLAEAANKLYEVIMAQKSYQDEIKEGINHLAAIREILGCYTLDLNDEKLRGYFMTRRRGGASIDVLPDSFLDEAIKFKENGERWRLTELLVPVPIYWVSKFLNKWFWADQDLGVYVTELDYSSTTGLQHPPDEEGPSNYAFI